MKNLSFHRYYGEFIVLMVVLIIIGFAALLVNVAIALLSPAHAEECSTPGITWSCTVPQCNAVPVLFTCRRQDGSTYAVPGFTRANHAVGAGPLDLRPRWLRERDR